MKGNRYIEICFFLRAIWTTSRVTSVCFRITISLFLYPATLYANGSVVYFHPFPISRVCRKIQIFLFAGFFICDIRNASTVASTVFGITMHFRRRGKKNPSIPSVKSGLCAKCRGFAAAVISISCARGRLSSPKRYCGRERRTLSVPLHVSPSCGLPCPCIL